MRLRLAALLLLGLVLAAAAHAREYSDSNDVQMLSPDEVMRNLIYEQGPVVVDVRPPIAYARGRIPGAPNIFSKEIHGRVPELEPYRERGVVFYDNNGLNAKRAGLRLLQHGFRRVYVMRGNLPAWERRGYPIEAVPPE